ncbi:MAG: phosphate ABC transporter substrate-binding protein PstS family protein [Enterococcus sp.]
MKKWFVSLALAALFLTGCASGGSDASQDSGSGSSSTSSKETKITAVGSTALQPLVEAGKDLFVEENPEYQISVQGGGSGTGLSQVADGAVTIGNSDLFAEEKDGVPADELVDHKVAVVGMAPVVNKDVGVTNVTQQELIDIFTGKITNWKDLGGKDETIQIINRASGSGTRATFEKWGLNDATPVKSQEQDSSGTVRQIVSQTPGAISYLAFSYLNDDVEALSLDDVEPTEKNLTDNSWKIWSYEHMYTKGEPSKEVKKFLDYMTSEAVQQGPVKKLGYTPITDMKVERDADGTVK